MQVWRNHMNKAAYVGICMCASTPMFMLACKACKGFLAMQGLPPVYYKAGGPPGLNLFIHSK